MDHSGHAFLIAQQKSNPFERNHIFYNKLRVSPFYFSAYLL